MTADAETIRVHGKHRSDVIFEMRGLRIVIEAKFSDHANASSMALADARKRVHSGIAHIAAAVVYPAELRSAPTAKILKTLEQATLHYQIISETQEDGSWFQGTPAELIGALRSAQEVLTREDVVERTAKSLSEKIETVSQLWRGMSGACDRLSEILGIPVPNRENRGEKDNRRDTATRVAALVVANAFIFQEQLSAADRRADTLATLEKSDDIVAATSEHWNWIAEKINYVPIFQLGLKVLEQLPSSPSTSRAVRSLLKEAQSICRQQTALRHDLMGRIYHWLLHDAKFQGTYYTSVSAATLLLKIAFALDWDCDFASIRKLANFKVADLACGTGTLLMATAQALTSRHVTSSADKDIQLDEKDISNLHQTLMQNVMHGYDILPTAVHLTASTLALLAPEVAFRNMNLYVMPVGLDHGQPCLGSLDFLDSHVIKTQLSLDDTHQETIRTGASRTSYEEAEVPESLDLCVMNPPFVSNRYGNMIFGSLPRERDTLKKELRKKAGIHGISVKAGLGAMFVALAKVYTKPGGRIAFVLPLALATGESWKPVRKLIANHFHLEVAITSHDPERQNFSENTALSEILLIARRREPVQNGTEGRIEKSRKTIYVKLQRNPRSIHEALHCASRVISETDKDVALIRDKTRILGELVSAPSPQGDENWTHAIFSSHHLARVYHCLNRSRTVHMPDSPRKRRIPLCRLDAIGTLGHDVRQIVDTFQVDTTGTAQTPYPAFWNHSSRSTRTIAQRPNATLIAQADSSAAKRVWGKSGRILLVSRLRTNTHRLVAIALAKKALGNTWWAFDDDLSAKQRKSLVLYLNSSLGILSYYGKRVVTEGAWVQMKKPAWESMQVLDVRKISENALSILAREYNALSKKELLAIARLDADLVRKQIDDALCAALRLPDLAPIRDLLAKEPGLRGSGKVSQT